MFIDSVWNLGCQNTWDKDVASPMDVVACVNSEIYDLFIWIFMFFGIFVFPLLAWFAPAGKT